MRSRSSSIRPPETYARRASVSSRPNTDMRSSICPRSMTSLTRLPISSWTSCSGVRSRLARTAISMMSPRAEPLASLSSVDASCTASICRNLVKRPRYSPSASLDPKNFPSSLTRTHRSGWSFSHRSRCAFLSLCELNGGNFLYSSFSLIFWYSALAPEAVLWLQKPIKSLQRSRDPR